MGPMFVPSPHPWTDPRSGGNASHPERYALLAGTEGSYLGISDGTERIEPVADLALAWIFRTHDRAVAAARESQVRPDDIEHVYVAGPQSSLAAGAKPKDVVEAIHSLPYYIASGIIDREFTWRHTDPKLFERPEIAKLISLVAADPTPPAIRYQWNWGATVTIVTKQGARIQKTVDAPRGSAPRGIEWSDVEAKYRALWPQSKLPMGKATAALDMIHNLDKLPRITRLTGNLQ